jgi:GDP-L-fucose synthase
VNKNSKIFIAGAAGMVGSAIIKNLLSKGYRNLSGSWHSRMPHPDLYQPFSRPNELPQELKLFQIDLTVQEQVAAFFKKERPE